MVDFTNELGSMLFEHRMLRGTVLGKGLVVCDRVVRALPAMK